MPRSASVPGRLSTAIALATLGCSPNPSQRSEATAECPGGTTLPGDAVENRCYGLPAASLQSGYRLTLADPGVFTGNGSYDRPVQLLHGTDELGPFYLLAHQLGRVVRFRRGEPPVTVLDLSEQLWTEHPETGLASIALHPDYPTTPDLFCVFATPGGPQRFLGRVARFARTGHDVSSPFAAESMRIVLDLPQPHGSHSVNHIAFAPDGTLFVAAGDGRNPGDPLGNGRDPNTLYATLMRLDVSAAEGGYQIPPDNPFVEGGGAPEVFAYGLRNPWRFSIDAPTGAVWVGDVGESSFEEIDRVEAGKNYGWSWYEGTRCYRDEECPTQGLEPPIFTYPHSEGKTVVGGQIYRGTNMPELQGAYVFADYTAGTLSALHEGPDGVRVETLVETSFNPVSFASDPDGDLFVVRFSREAKGGVFRLEHQASCDDGVPRLLSQTGCFSDVASHAPAPHLLAYDIVSPLWSDGSEKARFLALPPDARIQVAEDGDFLLPVGTTLVKSFSHGDVTHETRLLVHAESGWSGYTYRWLPDGSDAVLLDSGNDVVLPDGTPWHYPARSQCFRCHGEVADFVLGLEVGQLAREGPGSLADWLARGLFDMAIGQADELPTFARSYVVPGEPGDLTLRVRSYLHANCAFCHQPGGPTEVSLDLRFDTAMEQTGLCDVMPEAGRLYLENDDLRLIAPGHPELSILYLRMNTLNRFRMPPLASAVIDGDATALVHDWLELPGTCP